LPRARQLIIALAGAPGSGKSTIARLLAAKLDGTVASFGDYVRHLASAAGEGTKRSTLQRIGQGLVESDPEAFAREFLDWASPATGQAMIIDGVRHLVIDQVLRAAADERGRDYFLVLLEAPISERATRRCAGDLDALRRLEDHPVEREAATRLPNIADIIVDGSRDPDAVIALIASNAPRTVAALLT
jgi:cytidylate kinase